MTDTARALIAGGAAIVLILGAQWIAARHLDGRTAIPGAETLSRWLRRRREWPRRERAR